MRSKAGMRGFVTVPYSPGKLHNFDVSQFRLSGLNQMRQPPFLHDQSAVWNESGDSES
jgi:hypothetical protein